MKQKMKYRETELIPRSDREAMKEMFREKREATQLGLMLMHWAGCGVEVPLPEYAQSWVAAHVKDPDSAMRKIWPLTGPRMIADNKTDWGSYRGH